MYCWLGPEWQCCLTLWGWFGAAPAKASSRAGVDLMQIPALHDQHITNAMEAVTIVAYNDKVIGFRCPAPALVVCW